MDRRTRTLKPFALLNERVSLLEAAGLPQTDGKPPLKVDREKGIIYRVKVCGRYSPNNHGIREAEGTEYTPAAWHSEARLINRATAKVRANHPERSNPTAERDVNDGLGVLLNPVVVESGENPGLFADWHGLVSDPLFAKAMEDAEKGLGVYGLSHNARWGKADVKNGRLVIESIEALNGVDLVDKPATNSNLWESVRSRTVKFTLKSILESRKAKFSAPRIAWAKRLLEDGGYADPMAAETDEMPADVDPADAMKAAFRSAADQILDGMFDGGVEEGEGWKKLKELYRTHGKLTQEPEPEEPTAEESEEDDEDGKGGDDPSEKKDKAVESLRTENAKLKREAANAKLCLEAGVVLSPLDTRLLNLLESEADRKAFVAERKPGNPGGRPRSAAGGKSALESRGGQQAPAGAAGALSILRRG